MVVYVKYPGAMGERQDTKTGRRARFEREAMPHLDAMYSAALRLARTQAEAGELLEENVLRAYRSFDQCRPGTDCRAWLLAILYGGNLPTGRRRGSRETLAPVAENSSGEPSNPDTAGDRPSDNPDAVISQQVLDRKVTAAFNSLPADLRRLLILIDVEGLHYRQAARVLGWPPSNVRSRVSRARRMVRKALNESSNKRGINR